MKSMDKELAGTPSGSFLYNSLTMAVSSSESVQEYVDTIQARVKSKNGTESEGEIQRLTQKKLIKHYSNLAALSGAVTALPGAIPVVGTAVTLTGGVAVDLITCLKYQTEMVMALAHLYKVDIAQKELEHSCFSIAAGGGLERLTRPTRVRVATKSCEKALTGTLKGTSLLAVKSVLAKLGVSFTRKGLEKVIPLGVGVLVGASANKAVTRFIARKALKELGVSHS